MFHFTITVSGIFLLFNVLHIQSIIIINPYVLAYLIRISGCAFSLKPILYTIGYCFSYSCIFYKMRSIGFRNIQAINFLRNELESFTYLFSFAVGPVFQLITIVRCCKRPLGYSCCRCQVFSSRYYCSFSISNIGNSNICILLEVCLISCRNI